ncbi:MAG: cupredoxin domain-containing protein [Candidatus Nanopelagicales bacterium]
MSARKLALVALAVTSPLLIVGCSSDSSSNSTSAANTVSVTSTDTTCDISTNSVPAGATAFDVTNTGGKITEVYVYGKSGDAFTEVVAEVENVGPGTSRTMNATLAAGSYEIACKPGQTGNGIRTTLTVS